VPNPAPSSVTVNRRLPPEHEKLIVARDAPAYLAVFCSASRAQKYTAASVSCG
jgi:hypothetical protein